MKLAPGVAARRRGDAARCDAVFDEAHADRIRRLETDRTVPSAQLDPRERALARAILGNALRRTARSRMRSAASSKRTLPRKTGSLWPRSWMSPRRRSCSWTSPTMPPCRSRSILPPPISDARHFKGLVNAVMRRLTEQRDAILAQPGRGRAQHAGLAAGELDEEPMAPTRRGRSPLPIWSSHRSTSRSSPIPHSGPSGSADIVLPTGSVRLVAHGPIEALRRLRRRANGGFRMPLPRCRRACSAMSRARCRRSLRRARRQDGRSSPRPVPGSRPSTFRSTRLQRVRQNLIAATASTPNWLPPMSRNGSPATLFDAILLDAPCSATGTIRRHPDVALPEAAVRYRGAGEAAGTICIAKRRRAC